MVHLNYRDARPIYAQIVDGICGQVRAGILQNGDQLPSVRELAAQLAINPNTIQRAYRELEMGGWIATVPGKGCFVCGESAQADPRQEQLLRQFDEIAAALEALGMTKAELVQRLQQGGNDHA